jgi:hypothetical protein
LKELISSHEASTVSQETEIIFFRFIQNYIYSPTRLHGVMLALLSTRTALPYSYISRKNRHKIKCASYYCPQKEGRRILKNCQMKGNAKLQWLQDPSEMTLDNLNNIRREANGHFRNKKKGIS